MKIYAVLVLAFVGWVLAEEACITAWVESGAVCGARKQATNGNDFASFFGMPYAKAVRFAEPQRPDQFKGVFNATRPGPICPQSRTEFGKSVPPSAWSEDCLRINVHVPLAAIPDPDLDCNCKPLLPVYVYVHGGAFSAGSGSSDVYGPEYLVTKNVIVVTINYRLSSLGFLSLGSKEIPGNAGLKDILFSLKWIKRNIKNFGGDPEEVTLAGQSAGAALAHLVAISPAAKGMRLFKRTMLMSGNAISNFFTPSPVYAKIMSELFLEGMGISSSDSASSIHQQLMEAPVESILAANLYVLSKSALPLTFSPVIDTPQKGVMSIIPKDPEFLMREGYGKEYTTLLGFTNNECRGMKAALKAINAEAKIIELPILTVPKNLIFASNAMSIPTLIEKVSKKYFNGTNPTLDKFIDLCTDSFYKYTALKVVQKRLAVGAEPSFIYEFSYHGERSIMKTLSRSDWPGAGHSEDVPYIFRINMLLGRGQHDELAQTNPDSRMKDWMTTFVANYVKTGNPATNPADWPPSTELLDFQEISNPMEYHHQPATPYMQDMKRFFDELSSIGQLSFFG